MPFGNLNASLRIGVSNVYVPNGFRWGKEVLRLPAGPGGTLYFPLYQGVVVRNNLWVDGGPGTAGELCTTTVADSEHALPNVIRQISAHDTFFSRRNLSNNLRTTNPNTYWTPQPLFSFHGHRANRTGQLYYLTNEPETWSEVAPGLGDQYDYCNGGCWSPRSNTLDPEIPLGGAFFETRAHVADIKDCGAPATTSRRATSEALAYTYLQLKSYENVNGSNLLLLPPSAATPGFISDPFWQTFYDKVKNGATYVTSLPGFTASYLYKLKIIHFHYYTPPRGMPYIPNKVLETVAEGVEKIKLGMTDFRTRYFPLPQTTIPLDILLSEFGPMWQLISPINPVTLIPQPQHKYWWAGGWDNFKDGLSWWNTWLCWLMRCAPVECKLSGWTTPAGKPTTHSYSSGSTAKTLYANAHSTEKTPFVAGGLDASSETTTYDGLIWWIGQIQTKNPPSPNSARTQNVFNCDTGQNNPTYGAFGVNVEYMGKVAGASGRYYEHSFSSFPATLWDAPPNAVFPYLSNWLIGPFGLCYKVWAEVGNDPVLTDAATGWNSGWVDSAPSAANTFIGPVTLQVPSGYFTICFPVIKTQLGTINANDTVNPAYPAGTRFDSYINNIAWGFGDMSEFPESKSVNKIYDVPIPGNVTSRIVSPTIPVYSSMVFPVVCWKGSAGTISVKIKRNLAGASILFGRPIVFPVACSWLTNQ